MQSAPNLSLPKTLRPALPRSNSTQLNTPSNVRFPKAQAQIKKAAPKGTSRRDPLWTLAGSSRLGQRTKVPFQECQGPTPAKRPRFPEFRLISACDRADGSIE